MAIVGVSMKSSASAPPSAGHAAYITRVGKYASRADDIERVEHGNMPSFAADDPLEFWRAADANERANGRTYTELQVSIPRELSKEAQHELALSFAHEMMSSRHAYTLAIHCPEAADGNEQPHMHLMFTERVVDERTRQLGPEVFFKRNGAKKDRDAWHGRDVPKAIRDRWCAMANTALAREGLDVRLDPRTWEEQGRDDLAQLREPKGVRGREAEIAELRQARQLVIEGDHSEELDAKIRAEYSPKLQALEVEIGRLQAEEATGRAADEEEAAAARQAATKQKPAPVSPVLPTPQSVDAPQKAAQAEPAAPPPAPTVSEMNHAEVARIADELKRHGRATFAASINARVMMTLFGPPGRELLKNLEKGVPDGSTAERGIKYDAVLRFNADKSRELLAPKGNAANIARIIRKENDAMKLRADAKIKSPEKAKTPKVKGKSKGLEL